MCEHGLGFFHACISRESGREAMLLIVALYNSSC